MWEVSVLMRHSLAESDPNKFYWQTFSPVRSWKTSTAADLKTPTLELEMELDPAHWILMLPYVVMVRMERHLIR